MGFDLIFKSFFCFTCERLLLAFRLCAAARFLVATCAQISLRTQIELFLTTETLKTAVNHRCAPDWLKQPTQWGAGLI